MKAKRKRKPSRENEKMAVERMRIYYEDILLEQKR